MPRAALTLALMLVSCVGNPFNPHSLRRFPQAAYVDERVHLSPDDENQIFRLIYKHSSQQVSSVLPGAKKGTIEVSCGGNDTLGDVPRLTGDSFTLQKIGSIWVIVDKGEWMR